tara:strand:- start:497 stop:967 length:471 start_codon:yes stop_codon:yes gene_type:complete
MARITVEDCLEKVDSQYDLVLLAKERATQLNAGEQPLLPEDNDKRTVISLREIGEGKVSPKDLKESAINKLRTQTVDTSKAADDEVIQEDDFDKIYKGEISKSGTAILPSKRVRKITEKTGLKSSKKDETSVSKEEDLEDDDIDEADKIEDEKAKE